MARIKPIFGLRYGTRIGDKNLVVAPPYDVITREDQIRLHARHPKNIVWVDFGMERGGGKYEKYERAREILESFIAEGVLVRDEKPSLYYYEQEFLLEGLEKRVRKGFICGLLLEKFGDGSVFPHEKTMLSPKVDRLNLMKHTSTASSPIFGIYDDDENAACELFQKVIKETGPDVAVVDDVGVAHRMWVVSDDRLIGDVQKILSDRRVFIADGHHRYETALSYREWMREKAGDLPEGAWNYVLIFLSASGDDGLAILPTHRGVFGLDPGRVETVIEELEPYFTVSKVDGDVEELVRAVSIGIGPVRRFGMVDGKSGKYLLEKKGSDPSESNEGPLSHPLKNLDVSIFHSIVLERVLKIDPEEVTSGKKVKFYKDGKRGLDDLRSKNIQLFFFLNPVSMRQFIEVSEKGIILPQKSTYFYPKILTGLVLHPVSENDCVG